jgi:hypothetical protein
MTNLPQDTIEALKKENWDNIIPRLIYFAQQRIWRYVRQGNVLKGKTAENFVEEAIFKVWTGVRVWDRQKCPEVIELLFGVILSDVGHSVGSKNSNIDFEEGISESEALDCDGRKLESQTPIHSLLRDEQDGKDNDFLIWFIDSLGQDKQLVKLTEVIIDGCDKEAEMARTMGITAKEVYNLKKKLGRRLREYRKNRKVENPVLERGWHKWKMALNP